MRGLYGTSLSESLKSLRADEAIVDTDKLFDDAFGNIVQALDGFIDLQKKDSENDYGDIIIAIKAAHAKAKKMNKGN